MKIKVGDKLIKKNHNITSLVKEDEYTVLGIFGDLIGISLGKAEVERWIKKEFIEKYGFRKKTKEECCLACLSN